MPASYASPGQQEPMNQSLKDEVKDQFGKVADKAQRTLQDAADQAGQFASRAAEVGEDMQHVVGNVQTAMSKSVREQPMATLAIVAVLGFVLGAIWKS